MTVPPPIRPAGQTVTGSANGVGIRSHVNGSGPSSPSIPLSALPQPHASSSRITTLGNPQLGPEPYFAFPTPTREQLEDELPPLPAEEVPLGLLLDRVVRRGYGELRGLVDTTLPAHSGDRKKPQPIINYARSTRQSILKYLAVLRWKEQVDVPIYASPVVPEAHGQSNGHAAASFPTPRSSNDSATNDSPGYAGKGKGRAVEDGTFSAAGERVLIRGRLADTARISAFMNHQNAQHYAAVGHLTHSAAVVEGLRLRNPDILTAMSILSVGDYTRLPSELTETFLPKPPLSNRRILKTLHRLNRHIRYRLRCVDYIPPDLVILDIRDGRVYVEGGNGQWRAELTIINFGSDGDGARIQEGRWWLTGVEWGWREKERGVDDPGGTALGNSTEERDTSRRLEGQERMAVLDLANMEILPPRPVPSPSQPETQGPRRHTGAAVIAKRALGEDNSMASSPASSAVPEVKAETAPEQAEVHKVDAPLVRIYNFLQHLCLTYQLEVLYSQAMALAAEKWRGQLMVEMDRAKKSLALKYWIRPRPALAANAGQAANAKRPSAPGASARTPLVGGSLTVSMAEYTAALADGHDLLDQLRGDGSVPSERLLKLRLSVKWEVGEAGEGGGWKNGDVLDSADLEIDAAQLSIGDILFSATTTHATHLTRYQCTPLLTLPRIYIFPVDPPFFIEEDSGARPLSLRVPLPSQSRAVHLSVCINATTGLIDITDAGASTSYETPAGTSTSVTAALAAKGMEDRGKRAKMASASVNEGKTRLGDDVGRLVTAIITENLEGQMKALGHAPTRRLAIRSQDMAKLDLHPASTIFLPLPTSERHYLATKITAAGITFELLQLIRVPLENGAGMKLSIGERMPLDLKTIHGRRALIKRKRDELGAGTRALDIARLGADGRSAFILDNADLRDMFVYCNALVAQSIIESQLKVRAIPYTLQFPPATGPGAPKSRSPIAGMVPTFMVHAADLLKDGRAEDVAMPKVYMQIKGWWMGSKCSAVTVVQLRHRPSASAPGAPATSPAAAAAAPNPSRAAKAEGITFDQASSVVKFESDDLTRCVPGFLEQWERLSKVIVVAGTVNKLNRTSRFKDVRMLSFDLRTATLSYAPGYFCSITYNSVSDAYVVTFAKTASASMPAVTTAGQGLTPAAGLTPGAMSAATPGSNLGLGAAEGNPHHTLAGLLSCELNDLVEKGKDVGERFIGLLRSTLPFLLEVETIRSSPSSSPNTSSPGDSNAYPRLVVIDVRRYRLIWDIQSTRRYGVDLTLLPDTSGWIVAEAGLSLSRPHQTGGDGQCGRVEEMKGWETVVDKTWSAMRAAAATDQVGKEPGNRPPMKLDGGKTVRVPADMIGLAVRAIVGGVEVSARAAASAASARIAQQYPVSDDEEDRDLDELISDEEGEGDVKPPKGILHGALKPPRHITMSTKQLHEMIHSGNVNLNPSYQRDVVWPDSKMETLIQSLFLNYYVPPIIFAVDYSDTGDSSRVTIDGKQRCTTIQRFMDGALPYCAPDRKKYYYRKSPSGKGELLPQNLKTRFDMVSLVAVEYDQIADQTQRDIFQRVQLGVALSSAEKLQAIASPWTTWIAEMCKKYVTEPNTLHDLIRWDVSRGKPFQALTSVAMWCYELDAVDGLSPGKYRKFLDRSDPPDEGFKRKMENTMSIFVNIATLHHDAAFVLPTIRGKGPRSPVSPVEFWFIGYIIFTRMNKSSLAGLARTIRDFRIYARTEDKDLFTNSRTVTKYKQHLDRMPVVKPGPNEQVAAVEWEVDGAKADPGVVEQTARKRRREDREVEDDPDYRCGPIARGSKSDVVGHTRSKKPPAAPAAAYQPRHALPTIPTQRPPPTAMDAHVPSPALTATFGQSSDNAGYPPPVTATAHAPPPYAATPQYMYSSQHGQQGAARYNYQTGQGYRPPAHGHGHNGGWGQR